MIFVTGGTGFVGRSLIQQLNRLGIPVRILLRPTDRSPNLPRSLPVDVAICTLQDQRGLKAALKNVDTIFHLATDENRGTNADLQGVNTEGTISLVQAALESRVKHIVFLSHIGAAQASAYPLLKAKGISENTIIKSGIPYTILRSSPIFGLNDHFTTPLASLIQFSPLFFLVPGDGSTLLQPIYIDDLVNCLLWTLNEEQLKNQVVPIGGAEYLSFTEIVKLILTTMKIKRILVNVNPANLRILTMLLEHYYPKLHVSSLWLDYLSTDRIAPLDTLPRLFNLIPARMNSNLSYLLES